MSCINKIADIEISSPTERFYRGEMGILELPKAATPHKVELAYLSLP
jgi:hypothetical protein